METNNVRTERNGAVFVVTIDRPAKRNAIDAPVASALAQAFRAFDADAELAVAVLTGAGGTFCSGFDLTALFDEQRNLRVNEGGDGPLGVTRMLLSKPVIAAVEGYAVAGGFELALWCDLRVAAEDAVFGVYNRRWGVPLVDGGTLRLPRLIGHSHALDLILTGRGVSGEEALRMGLVNRLAGPGEALAAALQLAREIASKPQSALRSDRLSSYEQFSMTLPEALANEYRHGMRTLATGEMMGGLDAYASGAWRVERRGA